jgi:hypothetical protein
MFNQINKIPYTAGQDSEWCTKLDVQPLPQGQQDTQPSWSAHETRTSNITQLAIQSWMNSKHERRGMYSYIIGPIYGDRQ